MEYIVVEWNAWAFSGCDVLWAAMLAELYEAVELRFGVMRYGGPPPRRLPRQPRRFVQSHSLLCRLRSYFIKRALFQRPGDKLWLGLLLASLLVLALAVVSRPLRRHGSGVCMCVCAFVRVGLPPALNPPLPTPHVRQALLFTLAESRVWQWLGVAAALVVPVLALLRVAGPAVLLCCRSRAEDVISAASHADLESYLGFMHRVRSEVQVLTDFLREETIDGRRCAILLFVDDLDRVQKSRSVAVLEAITILLSDTDAPFFTFLAIDARVIVSAIEAAMSTGHALTNNNSSTQRGLRVNGYEYLK